MNLKIDMSGIEKLQRELKEAERALKELDGKFAEVRFDPAMRKVSTAPSAR